MTTTPKDPVDALMALVHEAASMASYHGIGSAIVGAYIARVEASARALAAVPAEPDMRHPKIQALIGARARCQIALQLVEEILENPRREFTAMDMEHWDGMHDKLMAALDQQAGGVPAGWQERMAERVREAHDASLDDDHKLARVLLLGIANDLDASSPSAVQPLSEAQPKGRMHACDDSLCAVCGHGIVTPKEPTP